MLLNISFKKVIDEIGHDGSEIWFPTLPEPACRRSFSLPELIDVAFYRYKIALMEVIAMPTVGPNDRPIYRPVIAESRLIYYMEKGPGLILGRYSADRPHLVAWDGEKVYDPYDYGQIYQFGSTGSISVESFFLACKI